jgi:hypothetical protein
MTSRFKAPVHRHFEISKRRVAKTAVGVRSIQGKMGKRAQTAPMNDAIPVRTGDPNCLISSIGVF